MNHFYSYGIETSVVRSRNRNIQRLGPSSVMKTRAINVVGAYKSENETIQIKIAGSLGLSKTGSYLHHEKDNVNIYNISLGIRLLSLYLRVDI